MKGYLIYDKKDLSRNQTFINWFMDTASQMGMTLTLQVEDDCCHGQPDFVINRSRKPEISAYFENQGIPVFNSGQVTRITNDKLATYEYFKDHVPMLPTELAKPSDYPKVVKHRFGHGGTDVHLVTDHSELAPFLNQDYIIQPLAPVVGKDLRVYIMGNEILDAVLRTSEGSFKANYSLGGQIALYTLNDEEKALVKKILAIMPLDYGGIDFLFDASGKLILNELEDAVGARMLYNLTDHNVVKLYLTHISSKLNVH